MTVPDPARASSFGPGAQDYDRYRPGYPDDAVAWFVPAHATRVADVGAGTGKLTGSLLARGLEVDAIEPDDAMLAVLRTRHPAARAHLAGADALPLPDGSVDAVLVAQAWHWFPYADALAQARRVLRHGGWLALVWNASLPQEPWEHELAALDPDGGGTSGTLDAIPGLDGLDQETASFPWSEWLSPEEIRARAATHSAYVVMNAGERDRRLGAVAAVAQAQCDRSGRTRVEVHQLALCVRLIP